MKSGRGGGEGGQQRNSANNKAHTRTHILCVSGWATKKKEYGWDICVRVCVLCRTQEGGSDRVNDPAFPVTTLPPRRRRRSKPYVQHGGGSCCFNRGKKLLFP